MATYVVGDVQGCYDSLRALLQRIEFDSTADRLILLGDLVNRGPKSAEVMQWVYAHRNVVSVILGNHDLHALAHYFEIRLAGSFKKRPKLQALMRHPDVACWMQWLRRQPLVRRIHGIWFVHAGFLPQWTNHDIVHLDESIRYFLGGSDADAKMLLETLLRQWAFCHEDERAWEDASDIERYVAALRVLVGVRAVHAQGGLPLWRFTDPPHKLPSPWVPWYQPEHAWRGTVMFGHWAAHGLRVEEPVYALDTGCVWGKSLTALRLEDRQVFQQPALEG